MSDERCAGGADPGAGGADQEAGARFARLKRILIEARGLPREERGPFLDRACAGDPTLRAEAASLLEHDSLAAPVIRTGALEGAMEAALSGGAPELPERIGPYRILSILGEGGMGIVYLAEQTEPIRREVAVKLIRRGLDTDRVVARFESERQTLALLDHPHIARVLDAGADANGRPYFVMERVSGTPITAFCDEHRLTLRGRLDLFLLLCQAVHHAHQRGIIHRDLKPSNVLVTMQDGTPFPKIIDFGIAKATGESQAGDLALTQEGVLVGTPEYMSPEQAGAGGGVDSRTDVYSLGVLLYELLTGRRPYRLSDRAPANMARAILQEEPGRPSTAVAQPRLRRELAGDLDNIVLLALRKEPDRRYSSVEHFAEDIRRHLTGFPVIARKDSWRYRTGKFVRRHAAAVAVAAAGVLWLAGLAITLSIQSGRVARERDRALAAEARAKTEAATSRQVSDFLVELFEVTDPNASRGNTVTAREILDRGAARIRGELHDQPVVQARLMATIGEVYHGIGLYGEARSLLMEALAVQERAMGAEHVEVAETLDRLGSLMHDLGETDASERHYRKALAIRRGAFGDSTVEVAESMTHLAVTLQARGELNEAEPLYRDALALYRRLLGPEHVEVAWGMNSLAWCLHQKGNYDEAERLYREALVIQRKLLGERHPDVSGTLNNLAGVRWHKGDYAEAETLWREALGIYRALYPEGHVALARAEFNVARVLRSEGKYAEAERVYRSSLAMMRRVVGEETPSYAGPLYGLGVVLVDQGRYDEAAPLLARSLALRRELQGREHPAVAANLEAMGDLRLGQGDARGAEAYFVEARGIREKRQPEGHPDRAIPPLGIARARLLRGDAAGALPSAWEAETLRRTHLGAEHPLTREAEAVRRDAESRIAPSG